MNGARPRRSMRRTSVPRGTTRGKRYFAHRSAAWLARCMQICALMDSRCLEGVRVLFVDDDEDSRTIVRYVLDYCGASTATAASASEAMRHMPTGRHTPQTVNAGVAEQHTVRHIREAGRLAMLESACGSSSLARSGDQLLDWSWKSRLKVQRHSGAWTDAEMRGRGLQIAADRGSERNPGATCFR
jgi:CheY-like chemotaxis protein